jgi:hypothetical protein
MFLVSSANFEVERVVNWLLGRIQQLNSETYTHLDNLALYR